MEHVVGQRDWVNSAWVFNRKKNKSKGDSRLLSHGQSLLQMLFSLLPLLLWFVQPLVVEEGVVVVVGAAVGTSLDPPPP